MNYARQNLGPHCYNCALLSETILELKEANDNCISLLLHECRMNGLQNEYDELKDRYEQACKSDNAHREALEKIEKTWQKYGHESAWQVLRDYGRTINTANEVEK